MTATTAVEGARPTIDFNQHTPYYKENWVQIAADLHATGLPLAWTEHHDGFWVLADIDAIHHVASDYEVFTSVNDLDGTENGGRGQTIPQMQYRLHLGESDPPLHTGRRRLEAPFFSPKALRNWRPVMQRHLNEAIDAVIEGGEADLIDDILIPATSRTTLYILGYDANDWRDAADAAHKGTIFLPGQPGYPGEQMARLRLKFREMLTERAANPSGDIISSIAAGVENGEPLSLDVSESMMNALVFGGFDTTVSSAAFGLQYLDQHREYVPRIAEDVRFRSNAIEELLRMHAPVTGTSRTALQDTELLGVPIKKGERVLMWFAGANRDPRRFSDPNTLLLDRPNANEHVTFSAGHHRCLGSPLAKIELAELLTIVPERLRDFQIKRDEVETYPLAGAVSGWVRVPVTFTPGTPSTAGTLA